MSPKNTRPRFNAERFLQNLKTGSKAAEYQKKSIVFLQGDPADAVFYIRKGRVQLTVTSEQGKAAVIGVLNGGNFFGEGCIAGQTLRMMTASAMTDCLLLRIKKSSMMSALHKRHQFAEFFVTYVLSRNIRYEADLVDQLFNSSEKRLARILYYLPVTARKASPSVSFPR